MIQPDETEAILADPDRDLVTLVTCTPLGINSHRILVTAERITPTPAKEIAAAAAKPELPATSTSTTTPPAASPRPRAW